MTTAIFGQTMGLFALGALSVAALRVAMIAPPAGNPAGIGAVGLPPPAAPTDAEGQVAKAATNAQQKGGHRMASFQCCKQPEDALERKGGSWASGVCGSSSLKPEVAASGFSFPIT